MSYLAACEMNTAFSEYVLYEPVLRILTAREYTARCEIIAPSTLKAAKGDSKRIDFEAEGHGQHFALEVKWAKKRRIDVTNDHTKLVAFLKEERKARAFLCVFGRQSDIKQITLTPNGFVEIGKPVFAELGITKYGCRIFETSPNKMEPTPFAAEPLRVPSPRKERAVRRGSSLSR